MFKKTKAKPKAVGRTRGQRELKVAKNGVVKIKTKMDYLLWIPPATSGLQISGINLKTVDSRILDLKCLSHLDLSGNRLTNVDVLRKMKSTLNSLNLSDNNISSLDSRLWFTFENLRSLNLSKNKLKMLPDSFVYLLKLSFLNVSENELTCIPYNMGLMISLRTLLIQKNAITFLPHPLVHNGIVDTLNISNNSTGLHVISKQNTGYLTGFGTGRGTVPTLLEMSAKAVLNMTTRVPASSFRRRTFPYLSPNALPAFLMEYLYKSKKCGKCRNFTCRYKFRVDSALSRTLGNQVTSDSSTVRILSVMCTEHDPPQ